MLSVVIFTKNSAEALAQTLTSLVPAVVDGLLRRVVVADAGSTDQTILVAEAMGCSVVYETCATKAIMSMPTQWLLVLQPGTIMPDNWEDVVREHIDRGVQPARFSVASDRRGWLLQFFGNRVGLEAGLLAPVETLRPFLTNLNDIIKAPQALKPQRLEIYIQNKKGEV